LTPRVGSAGDAEQALAVEFDRELSLPERTSQLDSAVSQSEQLRDQQVQQKDRKGAPHGAKLSEKEVKEDFLKGAFKLDKRLTFLPYQYFLIFTK
jgi:hypothetical protein